MSFLAANLFRVDGLVAVVTGGGTGLGLVMARALAANGARRVFLLGRRPHVLAAAAAAINAAEHRTVAVAVVCDVTAKASLQAAVDAVTADLERQPGRPGVHLLVANAGVSGPPARYDPALSAGDLRQRFFDETSGAAITDAFSVNVTGTLLTVFAFLELLAAADGGVVQSQSQIVVTASIAAFMRGPMSAPAYVGSKAALLQITKQLAGMLSPYRIRANALAPGLFPSEMASPLIDGRQPADEAYGDAAFIPARRFGTDEDLAGTILYLASRAGGFCNGLVLVVDGGRMAVTTASY